MTKSHLELEPTKDFTGSYDIMTDLGEDQSQELVHSSKLVILTGLKPISPVALDH